MIWKKVSAVVLSTSIAVGVFSLSVSASETSVIISEKKVNTISVSPAASPASKMVTYPQYYKTYAEAKAPTTYIYNDGVYYGVINVVQGSQRQLDSGYWETTFRGTVYKYVN